ncbi:MAG TPA: 30S ribosomal protein S7, partial [Lentisphaerae bacterium]|nr:30S ribosomal protein S7 [Lentisphaerota bacterium]
MARRRRAIKRPVRPDALFHSVLVTQLINKVMRRGKKTVAEKIVYGAMELLHEKTKQNPLEVLEKAVANVKPELEVKSRRVGGATYQVPVEVRPDRQVSLALRWIVQYAKARKGVPMKRALAMELLDAYSNQGAS